MSIREADVKLLWARSGNRCSYPSCNVLMTLDGSTATSSYPLGEMAHIVGEKPTAARAQESLDDTRRNAYDNLILLCPNHHTVIDRDPEGHPVALLHAYKTEHEVWVRQRTSAPDERRNAADYLYASLIDEVADQFFSRWDAFMSAPLSADVSWVKDDMKLVRDFRMRVLRAPFPGKYVDLEAAFQRLSLVLATALDHFEVHIDHREHMQRKHVCFGKRFYKIEQYDPKRYTELFAAYQAWVAREYELMKEATKAANLVCDLIRSHINPYFYLKEGRLLSCEAAGLGADYVLRQYSEEERTGVLAHPDHGLERDMTPLEKFTSGIDA